MTTNRSSARCSALYKSVARTALRLLIANACTLQACASRQQPGPFFGDEKYLVVGTDPDAEARRLSAQFDKLGFHVLQRLRGSTFTALGFGDTHDVPVKVRIITVRGIELALDPVPKTPLQTGLRYELIAAPTAGTQDADGDGFEDVFVAVRADPPDDSCIQAYRVRDSGFVDAADGKGFEALNASGLVWRELPLCELPADAEGAAQPTSAPKDEAAPEAAPTPTATTPQRANTAAPTPATH